MILIMRLRISCFPIPVTAEKQIISSSFNRRKSLMIFFWALHLFLKILSPLLFSCQVAQKRCSFFDSSGNHRYENSDSIPNSSSCSWNTCEVLFNSSECCMSMLWLRDRSRASSICVSRFLCSACFRSSKRR